MIANEEGTVRSRKYRSKAKGESNVNGSVKSTISTNPKNTKTRRKPKKHKKNGGDAHNIQNKQYSGLGWWSRV